jgi:hypothetical protein
MVMDEKLEWLNDIVKTVAAIHCSASNTVVTIPEDEVEEYRGRWNLLVDKKIEMARLALASAIESDFGNGSDQWGTGLIDWNKVAENSKK